MVSKFSIVILKVLEIRSYSYLILYRFVGSWGFIGLLGMPPRRRRNIENINVQAELVELRKSNKELRQSNLAHHQMMNELLQWFPTSPTQSQRNAPPISHEEDYVTDDCSTSIIVP